MNHLEAAPTAEFVLLTRVSSRYQSATLPKGFSKKPIASPAAVAPGFGFVLFEGAMHAAGRTFSTHSTTASIEHRDVAWTELRTLAAGTKLHSPMTLDPRTVAYDPVGERGPWVFQVDRKTFVDFLPAPNASVEPEAYVEARDAAEERPVMAIDRLKQAFEKQMGKQWWGEASNRYIRSLRRALAMQMVGAVAGYRDRFGVPPGGPSWLGALPAGTRIDFAALADVVERSENDADPLLARRMREVSGRGPFAKKEVVEALLAVAQGIRNVEEHGRGWPQRFRPVSSYLAKFLLYVFAAAFPPHSSAATSYPAPRAPSPDS